MKKSYSDLYIQSINWEEVQEFYDKGNFWKDIIKEFKFTSVLICYAVKLGYLKMRSRSESLKISKLKKPKYRHSQETKDKISKSRKEYLKNNPDKVPYLLNHSRNESYPEKYFTEIFTKEKIDIVKNYKIGLYELDFSIPTKKIDIEIDGSQHYLDKKIVESDIRRTKFLEENGWDVIRISWSDYQKMSFDEKSRYIIGIKNYIDGLIKTKPFIEIDKRIRVNNRVKLFCVCGSTREIKSITCNKCRGKKNRKAIRPSYDQLLKEISKLGYCGTGRKYGVSDNAIRKWVKNMKQNEQE